MPLLKSYQLWGDRWVRAGWRVQEHALTGAARTVDPAGRTVALGDMETCLSRAESLAPAWRARRAVLLLHSLAGDPGLLASLARRLDSSDRVAINIAYPNLYESLDRHAARVRRIVEQLSRDGIEEVSLIGHSLGGLVIRSMLRESLPVSLGRIVFIGTPNLGSSLGVKLHRLRAYQAFFGPSGQELLPSSVQSLPIPDTKMLVIAGGNGKSGYNPLIKGDDDGIVAVSETRLPMTEHDFIRVPCLHRWLPRHPVAAEAVERFIEHGSLT